MAGLDYAVLAPPRCPPDPRSRWRDGLLDAWRFDLPTPVSGQVAPSLYGAAPGTWAVSGSPTELVSRVSPWGPGVRFRTSSVFTNSTSWSLPTGYPFGLGTAAIPDFTLCATLSYEHTGTGSASLLYQHHNVGFGNRLSIQLRPTTPLSLNVLFGNDQVITFPSGVAMTSISRLVVVKGGSTWTAYLNGVLMGTASAGSATVTGSDAATPTLMGMVHDSWRLEARLYGRAWTAGEAAADALDPWALWRREPIDFPGALRSGVPWAYARLLMQHQGMGA